MSLPYALNVIADAGLYAVSEHFQNQQLGFSEQRTCNGHLPVAAVASNKLPRINHHRGGSAFNKALGCPAVGAAAASSRLKLQASINAVIKEFSENLACMGKQDRCFCAFLAF